MNFSGGVTMTTMTTIDTIDTIDTITIANVAETWDLDFDTINGALIEAEAWQPMCVQEGKPIKSGKQGSFLGVPDVHGGMPILRCPSFFDCLEADSVRPILDRVNELTGHGCNIVKVQKYVPGVMGIAPHSDKCIDMAPGVPIYILRLNKERDSYRSLNFTHKKTGEKHEFRMRHGDLMCIPYEVNLTYTHEVPSESGPDIATECISFVFRQSGTFRLPDGRIYGQSAIHKSYEGRVADARPPVSVRDSSLMTEYVFLYKFENETDLSNVSLTDLYQPFVQVTL